MTEIGKFVRGRLGRIGRIVTTVERLTDERALPVVCCGRQGMLSVGFTKVLDYSAPSVAFTVSGARRGETCAGARTSLGFDNGHLLRLTHFFEPDCILLHPFLSIVIARATENVQSETRAVAPAGAILNRKRVARARLQREFQFLPTLTQRGGRRDCCIDSFHICRVTLPLCHTHVTRRTGGNGPKGCFRLTFLKLDSDSGEAFIFSIGIRPRRKIYHSYGLNYNNSTQIFVNSLDCRRSEENGVSRVGETRPRWGTTVCLASAAALAPRSRPRRPPEKLEGERGTPTGTAGGAGPCSEARRAVSASRNYLNRGLTGVMSFASVNALTAGRLFRIRISNLIVSRHGGPSTTLMISVVVGPSLSFITMPRGGYCYRVYRTRCLSSHCEGKTLTESFVLAVYINTPNTSLRPTIGRDRQIVHCVSSNIEESEQGRVTFKHILLREKKKRCDVERRRNRAIHSGAAGVVQETATRARRYSTMHEILLLYDFPRIFLREDWHNVYVYLINVEMCEDDFDIVSASLWLSRALFGYSTRIDRLDRKRVLGEFLIYWKLNTRKQSRLLKHKFCGCFGSTNKRTIVGGWAWAWWLVTDVQRISLEVMTLNPMCEYVETAQGVPLTVTGVAQCKIMKADELLTTACEQFLGKTVKEIKMTILQTLEGHLRAILGHLFNSQLTLYKIPGHYTEIRHSRLCFTRNNNTVWNRRIPNRHNTDLLHMLPWYSALDSTILAAIGAHAPPLRPVPFPRASAALACSVLRVWRVRRDEVN
ncbi:Flotillin-2 [Eumeta japonica]|uniref:Flotillin-2 n=1 Tax=Eumeta variegata TaxID=151549 RepID=A0A4C1VYU2_EUMVA|nr:Flotillin-2 [Eumeta japonica]